MSMSTTSPAITGSSRTPSRPTTPTSRRGVAGTSTKGTSKHTTPSGRVRPRRCLTTAGSLVTSRPGRLSSATHSPDTSTSRRVRSSRHTPHPLPDDVDQLDKQRAQYAALKAARDRVLVVVLAYTAVRVGELLCDPDVTPWRAMGGHRPRGREYGCLSEEAAVGCCLHAQSRYFPVAQLPKTARSADGVVARVSDTRSADARRVRVGGVGVSRPRGAIGGN